MTIDELKERLAEIDAELSEIISELDVPADDPAEEEPADELSEEDVTEQKARTEELEKRSGDLMAERAEIVAEIEKAEAAIAEEKRAMEDVIANKKTTELEGKEVKNMEVRNTKEYIEAYANYIKTGDATECRTALTSTNDTTPHGTGTVAVPDFVYDIVKTAWNREGIMSRVRKSYLKGNLKVGFEISGGDAAIHAEGDSAVSEESLVLGTVTLTPQSIKKWIDRKVA